MPIFILHHRTKHAIRYCVWVLVPHKASLVFYSFFSLFLSDIQVKEYSLSLLPFSRQRTNQKNIICYTIKTDTDPLFSKSTWASVENCKSKSPPIICDSNGIGCHDCRLSVNLNWLSRNQFDCWYTHTDAFRLPSTDLPLAKWHCFATGFG